MCLEMEQWSKAELNSDVYIMKLDRKKSNTGEYSDLNFWLSDFKVLWNESFATKEELIKRISDENPGINVGDNEDRLIAALGTFDPKTTQITEHIQSDNKFQLELKYFMDDGLTLKFGWDLKKCDSNTFFEQITKALMHQIGGLEHVVEQLVETIKKKDDEIKQHKIEGAEELKRLKFVTVPFDEIQHISLTKLFNCEIDEFESAIGTLSKNVIKEEPVRTLPPPRLPTTPTKPRPRNNRIRPRNQKTFVRPVVKYADEDDDDDDDDIQTAEQTKSNDSNVQQNIDSTSVNNNLSPKMATVKLNPAKKIRRDFKI